MSERDDRLPMLQMLEHAREAHALVFGRRREDLSTDRLLRLALERLAEIVGEAANRVSRSTQERFPGVPWREAVSMRHRASHGYDTVDCDTLSTGSAPPTADAGNRDRMGRPPADQAQG